MIFFFSLSWLDFELALYSLTEDKPFEYFILLTIFVNCILLAANTPLPGKDKSDLNKKIVSVRVFLTHAVVVLHGWLTVPLHLPTPVCAVQPAKTHAPHINSASQDSAEIYLLAIFCLESLLKILAMGFIMHPGSYLRNGWNILDFTVVVTGWVLLFIFKLTREIRTNVSVA